MTSTIDKTNCDTGTTNEQYNLVSVLYHALEGAVTYEQYIEDAKQAGDSDLTAFFQELKETNCQTAETAKQLLKNRLS